MKKILSVIMIVSMVSSISSPAFAADIQWTKNTPPNNAEWNVAANWNVGAGPVPGSGDTAAFASGRAPQVGLAAGTEAVNSIKFQNGSCSAFIIGTNTTEKLTVDDGGAITVYNGVLNNQTFNAKIDMLGDYTFANNAATTLLNFNGAITGPALAKTLTLGGTNTGSNTISGVIGEGGGALGVTKTGGGNWILSNDNTYTGTTTVSGGTLQIGNGATGSLNGVAGTALTFSDSGGTINFNEAGGSGQGMGTLAFSGGDGTVQSTYGGSGATTLTFSSLSWLSAGATGNFITSGGTNGTTNSIILTGQAAGFIDKGVYFNGADYAAMDADNTFVRALAYGADPNTAAINTVTDNKHVKIAADQTENSRTLLSLNISGDGVDYTQNIGQTLTVPGIIKSGGGTSLISGGDELAAGGNLIVRTDTASDVLGIDTAISGTGLTKSGAGKLTLSGANTYTGTTRINAGTLELADGSAIADTGAVVVADVAGATLALDDSETIGALSGGGASGGTVNLGHNTLIFGDAASTAFSGVISGVGGGLTKLGAGTVTLDGIASNTHTGMTTISAGQLDMNKASGKFAIVADVTINGGTLKWLADNQLGGASNTITMTSGALDLNGKDDSFDLSVSGGTFTTGAAYLSCDTATLSGGTNTINADATVEANNLAITGGTNTVEGQGAGTDGGKLYVWDGGTGLEMTGATLTLDSDAGAAAELHLESDLTTHASAVTSNISSGLGLANPGIVDLEDETSIFTVEDGAAATDLAVSATITNGALTKEGAGTLQLSGTNTYTGITTINAGTVELSSGSAIDDTGAVVLADAAGAILKLNNSETIGSLSGGGAAGGNVDLRGNTLTVGDATSTTYNGVISNIASGRLTKQGTGTLTLTGANTYTGLTTVNAGTLNIQNDTATGTTDGGVTVASGATLALEGGIAVGAEALGVKGQGVGNNGAIRNISGDNSWAGVVTLGGTTRINSDAGTLTFGAGGITGDYGLYIGGAGDTVVDGDLNNVSMWFIKDGAGTLTLNGNNTRVGTLDVDAGTLVVGHANAVNVSVTNSATLNIGLIAASVSKYTGNAGSTLRLAVNGIACGSITSSSAGNLLNAAGTNLIVDVSGTVTNGATYTVIKGAGSDTYNDANITITDDSPTVSFTAATVGNDLVLTAAVPSSQTDFAGAATDGNGAAAGAALDSITNPTGDMATVINTMNGLSASQQAAALDTLLPQVDAGVFNTTTTILNNFVGVNMDRVEEVLTLAANATGSAITGVSAGEAGKLNSIWGKGYGSYLTQATRKGIAGYDAWNAGTAVGADRLISDNIVIGASGGWAYGDVDSDANNAQTQINSAQATVYGGYRNDNHPVFVDIAGTFAWNWYQGKRDINIGGAILRTANADYDGQQYGAYIGSGYKINVTKELEFTPLLSLQWSHLHLQSYTETEAGALNLSVSSQDYDLLQSGVGARIASPIKYRWGTLTPEAHGKWFYDFMGDDMVVTSVFNGGGASFNANGAKPARNSFNAGGKLTLDFKNDVSVIADCDTEMKDKFFGIYGSVTLRYQF